MSNIVKISSPAKIIKTAENQEKKPTTVVGIDFGTTNSLFWILNEKGEKQEGSGNEIKSILTISKNGDLLIGSENNEGIKIHSLKRLIGAQETDLHQIVKDLPEGIEVQYDKQKKQIYLIAFEKKFSLIDLVKTFFSFFGSEIEKINPTNNCVITVPSYFDNNSKNIVRLAAEMSGFKVLRILTEPTAAAIGYGIRPQEYGRYIVYDLGGGTFDVSILDLVAGVFQVVGNAGDITLGGDDLDVAFAQYINNKYNLNLDRYLAEKIKIALSAENSSLNHKYKNASITLKDWEDSSATTIDKTIKLLKNAVQESNTNIDEIRGLLLVGGSTKISSISKALQTNFPNLKIIDTLDPDRIVAIGAAIKAHSIIFGGNDILIDAASLSVAIETVGGIAEKIIPRNSPIPIEKSQTFTTFKDGQTGITISVLQGERELAKDCNELAKFCIKIPPMPSGLVRVEISFRIDVDGILTVSARDSATKKNHTMEISTTEGLDYESIRKNLRNEIENAKQDMADRMLMELKNEAALMLDAAERIKKSNPSTETKRLNTTIEQLTELTKGDDRNKIREILAELTENIRIIADIHANKSLSEVLIGKKINNS